MKKHKVIDRKNLPSRAPVYSSLVAALALDHWKAPDWVWGAVGLLYLILWIGWAYVAANDIEEPVDIFDDKYKNAQKNYKPSERQNN